MFDPADRGIPQLRPCRESAAVLGDWRLGVEAHGDERVDHGPAEGLGKRRELQMPLSVVREIDIFLTSGRGCGSLFVLAGNTMIWSRSRHRERTRSDPEIEGMRPSREWPFLPSALLAALLDRARLNVAPAGKGA